MANKNNTNKKAKDKNGYNSFTLNQRFEIRVIILLIKKYFYEGKNKHITVENNKFLTDLWLLEKIVCWYVELLLSEKT